MDDKESREYRAALRIDSAGMWLRQGDIALALFEMGRAYQASGNAALQGWLLVESRKLGHKLPKGYLP